MARIAYRILIQIACKYPEIRLYFGSSRNSAARWIQQPAGDARDAS